MHTLIQTLADVDADLEGEPRRAVPRLAHDLALPDQLRVVAADLDAARPDPASRRVAMDAIATARSLLF